MNKGISFIGVLFLALGLASCILSSRFTNSADYEDSQGLSDVYLLVVSDKTQKGPCNIWVNCSPIH